MQIANFFNPRTKSKDIKAERVAGFPLLMSPPLLWLFIDVSGCAEANALMDMVIKFSQRIWANIKLTFLSYLKQKLLCKESGCFTNHHTDCFFSEFEMFT